MTRFRIAIATIVAVAMVSLGAAACTPEQQAEVGSGLGAIATLILLSIWLPLVTDCPQGHCLAAV